MHDQQRATAAAGEEPAPPPVAQASSATLPPRSPYAISPIQPAKMETKADAREIQRTGFPVNSNGPDLPAPVIRTGDRSAIAAAAKPPAATAIQTAIDAKPAEDPPLVAALRCYLNKKPADAVIWLERYDRLNQDLLLCLLPLIARLADGGLQGSDPREVAHLTAQLERLTNILKPSAQLVIDKMCFCKVIRKFGVYDPFDDDHSFQPGELVQIYVEFENFLTRAIGDNDMDRRYQIQLASRMEIRDYNGRLAWYRDFKDSEAPDESASPRHDFFINYSLQIPSIPSGSYTLRLVVTDVPTKRKAERTLDFRVGTARG